MKTMNARQLRIHRIVSLCGFVLSLILIGVSMVFPELGLLGPAGVMLAAPTGTLYTQGLVPNAGDSVHRVPSVADALTMVEPSSYPFTTFTFRARRGKKPKQVVHQWGKISSLPRTDTINGTTTAGSANATKDITVDNGSYWRPNDLFVSWDNGTNPDNVYFIESIAGNVLTIRVMPTGSTAAGAYTAQNTGTVPIFTDEDVITWIGNAKVEFDVKSQSRIIQPAYEFNYVQTLDHVIDWSDHKEQSENFGPDDVRRYRTDGLKEFRKSMEYNAIFNASPPSVTTDGTNLRHIAAGLRYYVTDSVALGSATPSQAQAVDLIYALFADNNGSRSKILMGGRDLMKAIDKANLSDLFTRREENKAGVQVNQIVGRMGQIGTVYHPGFDEVGLPDEGVCVDFNFIECNFFKNMEQRMIDLRNSGTAQDGYSELWTAKLTHTIRYGGTGGVHKWVTIT